MMIQMTIPYSGATRAYYEQEAICRAYNMPFHSSGFHVGAWHRKIAWLPRRVDGGDIVWLGWLWWRFVEFIPMRALSGEDPFNYEYRGGNRRGPNLKKRPPGMKESSV